MRKLPLLVDLGQLFFPRYCRACTNTLFPSEELICLKCLNHIPRSGYYMLPGNPVEKIFWGRLRLEQAFSFLLFSKRGKVQRLLHELKYRNCPQLGFQLGKLMGKEILSAGGHSFDVIVPVPLHPRKERIRGYNQSEQIANGLAHELNIPVVQVLERRSHGESQTKKSKFDRWVNVSEVFGLLPHNHLQGRHIMLVDDVITTGSTIEACGIHLLKIPDSKLSVASLAFPMN